MTSKMLLSAVPAAGGGGITAPTDIAGCIGWWEADATLYTDSARTTVAGDTDSVGSWSDQSASAAHLNDGTYGVRPELDTADPTHGLPAVVFDGTTYLSTTGVSSGTKPFSALAVVRVDNFTGNAILGSTSNGGMEWRFDSTKMDLLKQFVAGVGTSTTARSTSTWYVLGVTYSSGGTYTFYVNGSADGTGTNSQTFTAANTVVGRIGSPNDTFTGRMSAVVKYDSDLSSGDLLALSDFYGSKYGVY